MNNRKKPNHRSSTRNTNHLKHIGDEDIGGASPSVKVELDENGAGLNLSW